MPNSRTDWNDLASVIAYARRLGAGMIVLRYPERANFNITHAERERVCMDKGAQILHRT